MIFTINQLKQAALKYPQGLYDEMLNNAILKSDDIYEIEDSRFEDIIEKYRKPSLSKIFNEILNSAASVFENGIEFREKPEIQNIFSICIKCPKLITEEFRCGVCGCALKLKVKLKAWHCPIEKW